MLKAWLHRKLRWPSGDPEDDVRDATSDREDPLTASVFERLAYLEPDLAWDLVRATCEPLHGPPLPEARPAGLPAWSFWPRLPPGEQGRNLRHVEPDVVATFGDVVLVVEAKHRGGQRAEPWIEEARAARAARAFEGKRLWIVAADGMDTAAAAAQRDVFARELGERAPGLLHLRWARLCEEIHERLRGPLPAGAAAVLRDLLAALALWGYRRRLGFDSLPRYAYRYPIRTTPADLEEWKLR
ncbi:MAG TPA: hypothetical protein VLS89_14165 [Candidatus Nanopelagicales bacterium]|nr:hypothetical protein [Candidatus Nanopelagicales bacterium]